jgi:choice-of-anchor C domain-containing protein
MRKFNTTNPLNKIAIASLCLVMITAVGRANLLVNGSFETNPGTNGTGYYDLQPGDTRITGWVVEQGPVDCVGTEFWYAADGLYAMDLNGSPGIGGIKQTFGTTSGQMYSVTFDMAGNPSVQALMTMKVQAAGQATNFSFSTVGHNRTNNMGWVQDSWNFTAVDTLTTLEFLSTFSNSVYEGPAIDAVSVVAVPEPSTMLLTLGGALAVLSLRKRFKQ